MTPLLSVKLNIPEIGGTDIVFHLVEFLDVLDVTRLMMVGVIGAPPSAPLDIYPL